MAENQSIENNTLFTHVLQPWTYPTELHVTDIMKSLTDKVQVKSDFGEVWIEKKIFCCIYSLLVGAKSAVYSFEVDYL